ncbi:transposase [Streptomyces sp. S1D4-23]|uniref:transposase n=1 Tax=Streptomyces sp. S1D4-23 TaxID=2594463 RepID=UPI0023DD9FCC|nr:transposase [Streptomyces sp. S1D4-23]
MLLFLLTTLDCFLRDHPSQYQAVQVSGGTSPHLITNVETTNATVNDTEVTATIHQHLAERGLRPREHVVDAGYVTAAHILAAREDHGIDLVGPVGADTHHNGRDAQAPDLTQAAFTTNWDARQVTCPQGASSVSWSQQRKASGTPLVRVRFALADCDPCPLRARCTKAANGKWGRSLTLLPREQQQILEERRAEQQTDEWKARYDVRAGVEGTISQAVRRTHLRRTPYQGQHKTHLANVLSATALNLTRIDAWLNNTPLGTTRVSHLARLTLAA